nr:tRNA pseudouridine synthase A [Vibrio tasmaniensis 1F-187]
MFRFLRLIAKEINLGIMPGIKAHKTATVDKKLVVPIFRDYFTHETVILFEPKSHI